MIREVKKSIPGIYCLWAMAISLLLTGCSLTSQNGSGMAATPDSEPAATRIIVDIEPIPDSLVEATPAPNPLAAEVIPEEFRELGRDEKCTRPCLYGIELGQTMEESIATIRENPWTDTTRTYQDGDYIDIYTTNYASDREGKGISWQLKVDMPDGHSVLPFPGHGSLFTRDNYVYLIGLHPSNMVIPMGLIIEEYGKPHYMRTTYMGPNQVLFELIYLLPDAFLKFNAYGRGTPSMLSEHSFVARVSIGEFDFLVDSVCSPWYDNAIQEWQGFGGLGLYYDRHGEQMGTIPFDCEDPQW